MEKHSYQNLHTSIQHARPKYHTINIIILLIYDVLVDTITPSHRGPRKKETAPNSRAGKNKNESERWDFCTNRDNGTKPYTTWYFEFSKFFYLVLVYPPFWLLKKEVFRVFWRAPLHPLRTPSHRARTPCSHHHTELANMGFEIYFI